MKGRAAFLLVLLAFGFQVLAALRAAPHAERVYGESWTAAREGGFSSAARAAASLLGVRTPAGHAYWIRSIQYYGNFENARDGRYRRLSELLHLVTDLNPHFLQAYRFGASVLAFHVDRPQEAVNLLEKGVRHNPRAERLHLLLAAITYRNLEQYGKVVPILEREILTGDPSPMLVNILANVYKKAGEPDKAVRLWKWILRYADTGELRHRAARELDRLRSNKSEPEGAP